MRKITDFIVEKRYFILTVFIILVIICGMLSTKVTINYDITKYLPSTSETRQGMDIMETEFEELGSSSFNIMFKGISDEEKKEIYNYLNKLDGIERIEYDETEKHNKDDYTMYGITVEDNADSELAANVFNQVTEKYKDYEIATSGDISEKNSTVLEFWIILLAVGCALIILIIMCESYIEPFLFLTAILMAVLLNKGTNLMFDSVSHITEAIAAILQLALSMDYSIMLMNRYNQEKEKVIDKVEAMKEALSHAFSSISSSSVTTIVGLIALVFMSFTIGKDLGFVLAKGVLFSLISIFCVLPALILIFDKLIIKTKKKSPSIKMDNVGKISYKLRFIGIPLFLIIFIASFCLKGSLGILYTSTQQDKIASVFLENNQMAIIYNNEDEDKIAKILQNVEEDAEVEEALAYSNTINEKLKYDELNPKFSDLGVDVTVDDYLLKILYYNYYNKNKTNEMTFNQFISFIKSDIYSNPKLSDKIDKETKTNLDRLENFTTEKLMNKKKSASEIAKILEIDEGKVNDVLIYYSSKHNDTKISMNDFIKFMNNDVLKYPKYSSSVDSSSKASLDTLSKFTSKKTIQKKMNEEEIAKLFGVDEKLVKDLYKYYIIVNETNTKMTLAQFSNFVLNGVLTNPEYSSSIDANTVNSIKMLATFSNVNTIKTEMNADQLSALLGIDKTLVSNILSLINPTELTSTPLNFVNTMITNEAISSKLDSQTLGKLKLLSGIMNSSINNISYSYSELANFIGTEANTVKSIYTLYSVSTTKIKLTPQEFVNFIIKHKNDEMLSGKLSKDLEKQLYLVQKVMNDVINNKKYSDAELSKLLGLDKEKVQLLYGLYTSKHVNTNQTISLKNFVEFLLSDVVTNPDYSDNFNNDTTSKLNTVNGVMEAARAGEKYTPNELMEIISVFTDSVDRNLVELLYIYYGSENEYNSNWELTIEEFVKYLNEDILQNEKFEDFIEDDIRKKVTDAEGTVNDAKKLIIGDKHSRVVINSYFYPENEETFAYIEKIENLLKDNSIDAYLIGNSPMAYEMSHTFDNELNFITILTMIAIFVVVAITFKSILIPIILVFTIQCAVYMTMGILSFSGEGVYFIALLIVQSILMGATIDYAILYTSYYLEHRKTMNIKDSVINSYNKSINTILTSSSILIIVTLIVANFASAIAGQICKTVSEGTLCSAILILVLLPAMLASCDKIIIRNKKTKK